MTTGQPAPHRARKRFGQNFLTDSGMIGNIVRTIAPGPGDRLVEIGPGQGALTRPLLEACPALQVVELDRDLVVRLQTWQQQFPGLQIYSGDALAFDFASLADGPHSLRVVGNLPYNISTPLIFHLLQYHHQLRDMHFMLQKEVVERLAAGPGSKHYGRLSVMVQYFCRADNLFTVPPECFSPRPKVMSAIVRLTPHRELPCPVDNLDLLKRLVNITFQQRRKTLRNSMRSLAPLEVIESLDVDISKRPENISVETFVALANTLQRQYADQLS